MYKIKNVKTSACGYFRAILSTGSVEKIVVVIAVFVLDAEMRFFPY